MFGFLIDLDTNETRMVFFRLQTAEKGEATAENGHLAEKV